MAEFAMPIGAARFGTRSAPVVTGGELSYATESATPVTKPSISREPNSEIFWRSHDRAPKGEVNQKAAEVLYGSVYGVGEEFLHVVLDVKSGKIEVDVPIQLCPEELQYEGVPLEIMVGAPGGFQSLTIKRGKGREISTTVRGVVDDALAWVDSL